MVLQPFQGKPMIKEVPEWNFLDRYFGKPILKEYYKRMDSEYDGADALKVLSYDKENMVVEGSNPFAVVLVDQIVKEFDPKLRVATPSDLERIIEEYPSDLKGNFIDSALILRGKGRSDEPNHNIAKSLYRQIKYKRGKPKLPAMIDLSGLGIIKDDESKYKLNFNVTNDTKITYAPQFKENNFNFSKTDKNGIPIFDGTGNRMLVNPIWNDGVQKLFLGSDLSLVSTYNKLDVSDPKDRIIIVKNPQSNLQS